MYESFYNLSAKPFRLSPDQQFFYPSAGHKRALSYLLYGLNQAEGFVVITGAPGTGKTTLAHKLLSQIDAQSVLVAHLASTQIEAEDLLRLVAASFKLRSEHVSKAGLLKDIESFLLARAREHKRCLLVVDEAQNLPPRSIEELRMLSNFQVGGKSLLQVFLLGQEQFRVMLDSPHFEQLRQRVIADYHLQPLDAIETGRYIEARLQHVGWQNDPQIDAGAHAMIFEYTGGVPRRINMLCDRLFLYGYLEGLHTLTHANTCSVIAELRNGVLPRNSNVAFTPEERPLERPAAAESSMPTPAAVRTPTPEPVPPPLTIPANLRPATRSVEPPQTVAGTTPITRRPTKPVEVIQKEAARAAPAKRSVVSTKPARDIPDFAIADFLLADERGISADQHTRAIFATSPSLASTESRWLLMIISACVLLAILAFWFFPSIHGAFQPARSPQLEVQAPIGSTTSEPVAAPAQQIGDPSENILTERRILTLPPPAIEEDLAADAPEELVWENKTAAVAPVDNKTASNAAATPAKMSDLDKKLLQKAKPAMHVAQSPAASVPAILPAPKSATAPKSPGTNPSTAMASTPGTGTSATAISQRELALLVQQFSRYYEEGNLPLFLSLFDPQVRTESSDSIDAIRDDYADLFKKTAQRQILLGDISWDNAGRLAQGNGPFEVRISAGEGEPARSIKGSITIKIEKKDSGMAIVALYHKPQ